MESTLRESSILTGKKNLEVLTVLSDFPVFIGCTDKNPEEDYREDLEFTICRDTGIIQIRRLIDPGLLYREYHSEALGKVWHDHHLTFSKFILRHKFQNVLEIGGATGDLAKSIMKRGQAKQWTIVEPAGKDISPIKRVSVISDFFPSKKLHNKVFDTVVHSHVFEHFYDPLIFLESVKKHLEVGGRHIFSVPHLYEYVRNKQTNALNFEHTLFLTEEIIDYLLLSSGFEIEKKEYYRNHSIFYSTVYTEKKFKPDVPRLYKRYKSLFLTLIEENEHVVQRFNTALEQHEGPRYIFGAHVFTQFLLALGLKENMLSGILDNSIHKCDKRLYGSSLTASFPSRIIEEEKPLILLRAGAYQEEIKKQLYELNDSVVFCE